MAEVKTPQGLVVGLIVDQPDPAPAEAPKKETQAKKPARAPKK